MEKYLRCEPRLIKPSSCKRSRLSSKSYSKNKGSNFMGALGGCKSPSVDDILAFQNHNDDEIMLRLQKSRNLDVDSEGEDRLSLDELNLWDDVHHIEAVTARKQQRINCSEFLSGVIAVGCNVPGKPLMHIFIFSKVMCFSDWNSGEAYQKIILFTVFSKRR